MTNPWRSLRLMPKTRCRFHGISAIHTLTVRFIMVDFVPHLIQVQTSSFAITATWFGDTAVVRFRLGMWRDATS
jgi:hypothetical protein